MLRSLALPLAASLTLAFSAPSAQALEQLTLPEVQTIIAQAVSRAKESSPNAIVAVTDREGFVLGVWSTNGTQPDVVAMGAAIREAGTAAYLSSNSNAFTSRTAQFIIQQNFPPGVANIGPGPLVGVAFSNLPFSDVNRFKGPDAVPGNGYVTGSLGLGVPNTRLSGRCASVPLFKNSQLVGGIGVFPSTKGSDDNPFVIEIMNESAGRVTEEDVALSGAIGFLPPASITADKIIINGIRFPFVAGEARPASAAIAFASLPGIVAQPYALRAAPPMFAGFEIADFGGGPSEFRFPPRADPFPGQIRGQPRLSEAEVRQIIRQGAVRASTTRGAIRQPVGSPMACWIVVVGNPNAAPGDPSPKKFPPILGIYRTPDAPFFSFDVAAQKARTALFFSSDAVAQSSRTVGFLAQDFYPPGLNPLPPGPYGPAVTLNGQPSVNGLQLQFTFPPAGQATASLTVRPADYPNREYPVADAAARFAAQFPGNNATILNSLTFPGYAPNPNLPNGITIFPGGFPLYRNGVLIGAVGVSGDGVDQDDIVGTSGTVNFEATLNVRADSFTFGGARLPYAKFPRNADNVY